MHVIKQFNSTAYSFDNIPTRYSLLFALDESKGTGKGYDTLYIDVDGSKDLRRAAKSSAEPSKWNKKGIIFRSAARVSLSRVLAGSNNHNLGRLSVEMCISKRHLQDANCVLEGGWVGEAETSIGKIPFLLVDCAQEGRFDQSSSMLVSGQEKIMNMAAFDWRQSGKFGSYGDDSKMFCINGVASIAGKLYALQSDASGSKLIVRNYTGPTSKIALKFVKMGRIDHVDEKMLLLSKSSFYLADPNGGPVVEVPEGDYRVGMSSIYVFDISGNSSASISYYQKQSTTAKSGEDLCMQVGGDPSLAIAPDWSTIVLRRGTFAGIPFEVKTSTGGYIHGVSSGSGEYQPELTIRDAAGAFVYSSKSMNDYCDWTERSVNLPSSVKPGDYTAEMTVDLGPFGGVLKATKPVTVR
jgi:hypothetical protein